MQDRILGILSDAGIRQEVRADYVRTFQMLGLAEAQAALVSDDILEKLSRADVALSDTEREVFAGFRDTQTRSKYIGQTNIAEAFDDALKRRARAFSGQIMVQIDDLDAGGTVANVSTHHEPLVQRGDKFAITETDDPDDLGGSFHAAVLNNVLHHETPERAAEILSGLSGKVTDRLVVVENTTLGATEDEQARDTALQFMHEYLFHRLLQDPAAHDTALPGNYDTAEGWAERIEALGWRLTHRDSFALEPHHTVLVFEKDAPG